MSEDRRPTLDKVSLNDSHEDHHDDND